MDQLQVPPLVNAKVASPIAQSSGPKYTDDDEMEMDDDDVFAEDV